MAISPVYICFPKRTAIGGLGGALSSLSAPEMASRLIRAIVAESQISPEVVDEIILGCVLTAGVGQAPARQAALLAQLPNSVQALTVNKVCSSGLMAVMLAARNVWLGLSECVIAGGMESMSRAPYLVPSLRGGAKLGHVAAEDSIIRDGLWDVCHNYHMGNAGELCAKEFGLNRELQDSYAAESYARANNAIQAGHFASEIVPVVVKTGKGESTVQVDEEPGKFVPDKLAQLRPVFDKNGTITAANASSISDGASLMLVCSERCVREHKLEPSARIVEQAVAAKAPEWFTTAPVDAVGRLLQRAGRLLDTVDLFEINEAFSAVALACREQLKIPSEKLNVSGGAVALGHPIGASGARILTTLIHNLRRLKLKSGVAAICNGGGEATAVLVEQV